MKRSAIVWFRQDLRLHDNEALTTALRLAEEVIPVYVFDERVFMGHTSFGFRKTGPFRTRFILESIEDLRHQIRQKGSDLVVRIGKPEEVIAQIAHQQKAAWVVCNRERTREEVEVQDSLEQKLWQHSTELVYTRGKMLYHTQDLPVPVQHTPDIFSQFRKETEGVTPIRPPLPTPDHLPPLPPGLTPGDMPTLTHFGHMPMPEEKRGVMQFKGGETEGLARLHHYFWETGHVSHYKETRNGLVGPDYSSKFSPWLAQGCLSPKQIYAELQRYEARFGANQSTYWLFFELLWRDFFRLMGKKHGNKIFLKGGIHQKSLRHLKNNRDMFQLWAEGKTGVPFVDANLRELNATGWMSNRGRQNAASFLVRDLKVNWQMGAEYFESQLIDYDPCSNWGNWNYVAGVGSDPREDRYFNILTQAKNYDPDGQFVRRWCPELALVAPEKIHRPDLLSPTEKLQAGAVNYPKPVVKIEKWAV